MQRRARLLVAALLVLAGGALAFAGSAPASLSTVAEVAGKAPGESFALRGTLKPGSVVGNGTTEFVVADGGHEVRVRYAKPLPVHEAGGTLDGRIVVLRGTVLARGLLEATDLQVGCASKYEPA